MIKHIVMWRLKDEFLGQIKSEIAKEMKTKLENLQNIIKEINKIEVGINQVSGEQAFDIVLYTEFVSYEAMAVYQKHPEHLKVVEYIKQVSIERTVVDYELTM